MNKYQKYAAATRANLTDEELKRAKENWEFARSRFPEEHALSEAIIRSKGLSGHREIHEHYAKYKVPISQRELGVIGLFADTSYSGAFGRGIAHEDPTTAGGTKLDEVFRPSVKPDGA